VPLFILGRHLFEGDLGMIKKTFAQGVALMMSALIACIPVGAQTATKLTTAKLTIHADQPVSKVSPDALWADDRGDQLLVRRRAVCGDGEEPDVWRRLSGILHWVLLEYGSAQAKIGEDRATGPSKALGTA